MEQFLGSNIPKCIKTILISSGFDCEIALKGLNSDCIVEIESHIQNDRHILLDTPYQNIENFKFLPGHRTIILSIPAYLEELKVKTTNNVEELFSGYQYLSSIMRGLLETANNNKNKHPKAYRYSEMIRYFATYVFLMCGRACYDTLCANLPIPKTETIGKYVLRRSHMKIFFVSYITMNTLV